MRTVASECREAINVLGKIWLELGIKDEQRQTRNDTVITLIKSEYLSNQTIKLGCITEKLFKIKDFNIFRL